MHTLIVHISTIQQTRIVGKVIVIRSGLLLRLQVCHLEELDFLFSDCFNSFVNRITFRKMSFGRFDYAAVPLAEQGFVFPYQRNTEI